MPQCQFLFSAVFGFRKVTQEIFSELDKTNCEVPIFTRRRRSPKESRRGATWRPHQAQARPDPGPRLGVVWAPLASPDLALPPISSPSQENPKSISINPRKVPSLPSSPTLVRGTEVSVLASCRDGELPPDPSPSTPPPSSSPLLTPMMRRE